jgi:hypothetical protein
MEQVKNQKFRNTIAQYSGEPWNLKIPLAPFVKGGISAGLTPGRLCFISLLLTVYEEQETMIWGSPGGGGTA